MNAVSRSWSIGRLVRTGLAAARTRSLVALAGVALGAGTSVAQQPFQVVVGGVRITDNKAGDLDKDPNVIRFRQDFNGWRAEGTVRQRIRRTKPKSVELVLTHCRIEQKGGATRVSSAIELLAESVNTWGTWSLLYWVNGKFYNSRGRVQRARIDYRTFADDVRKGPPIKRFATQLRSPALVRGWARARTGWTYARRGNHDFSSRLEFELGQGDGVCFPDSLHFAAVPAGAQGGVPPATVSSRRLAVALNPPRVPGRAVEHAHMIPVPGRPDQFLTALAIEGLPQNAGGAGKLDLLTGIYDAARDVFTPDGAAAPLNTPADETGLELDPSGLVAVWDRDDKSVWVATRPRLDVPFRVRGRVVGLPRGEQDRYDPALALHGGGTLHLMWTDRANEQIVMAPLDLRDLSVGQPVPLVGTLDASHGAPSRPSALVDSRGEIFGLLHSQDTGRGERILFSSDLDPVTPALPLTDFPAESAMAVSYSLVAVERRAGGSRTVSWDAVWWTGAAAGPGQTADMTVWAPPFANGSVVSVIGFAPAYLPLPVSVPGVDGKLGVAPPVLLLPAVHDRRTGRATASLRIPPDPLLGNMTVPAQTVTLLGQRLILGNTGSLRIE